MTPLHPRLRARLRSSGPIHVPPPPPGLAGRVVALARAGAPTSPGSDPEPFLVGAALLALAVLGAGLVFWNLPGQGTIPAPDFIEASQFVFSQLIP